MRRKKIKFSPKLQSSSLDDIKRFVPKDALNTPVISSYNTLPISETPYIDQSEFTNTNPSFGVYANGPQQGRNRHPFGPTYRTQNPEYQNGGVKYISDPKEFKARQEAYSDSLNLYKAYQFQKANQLPFEKSADPIVLESLRQFYENEGKTFEEGLEGRKNNLTRDIDRYKWDYNRDKALTEFSSKEELLKEMPHDPSIEKIYNYYESLPFYDKIDIGNTSSPDLYHRSIKPVDSYWDGSHVSPVYKKPTQPVTQVTTMAKPIMGYEERPQWSKDRAMMNRMKQYAKPSKPSGRLFTAHENMAKEGRATRAYNPGDNTGERKVVANYQMGGQAPTRLDSINLLQNNKILADLIAKGTKDVEFEENSDASQDDMYNSQLLTKDGWTEDAQGLVDALNYEKKGTDPNSSPPTRRGNLVGAKDWWHGGGDDDDFPTTYRHRFIDPQGQAELTATQKNSSRISKALGLNSRQVHIYTYDDLAITPFDMLTPEQKKMRVEKYGSKGVPDSYLKNQTSTTPTPTPLPPVGSWWSTVAPMQQAPVIEPGQLQTRPLQEDRLTTTAIAPSIEFPETTRYTAADYPMIDTKARREGRVGNTVVPRGDFNKGDNKGRVEIFQNGGLHRYQQ